MVALSEEGADKTVSGKVDPAAIGVTDDTGAELATGPGNTNVIVNLEETHGKGTDVCPPSCVNDCCCGGPSEL